MGVDKMFLLEYIKNPRKVGAIAPSSKHLACKMVESIDFEHAKCIVEYGPGTGVFTEKLLARAEEDTKIILFEINKEFYEILVNLYGHKKNVIILNESAENIKEVIKKYNIKRVDYIVSGLPFISLPKEVSEKILKNTADVLKDHGKFITFQYSMVKKKLFKKFFPSVSTKRTLANIPPAYVLSCNN